MTIFYKILFLNIFLRNFLILTYKKTKRRSTDLPKKKEALTKKQNTYPPDFSVSFFSICAKSSIKYTFLILKFRQFIVKTLTVVKISQNPTN